MEGLEEAGRAIERFGLIDIFMFTRLMTVYVFNQNIKNSPLAS